MSTVGFHGPRPALHVGTPKGLHSITTHVHATSRSIHIKCKATRAHARYSDLSPRRSPASSRCLRQSRKARSVPYMRSHQTNWLANTPVLWVWW